MLAGAAVLVIVVLSAVPGTSTRDARHVQQGVFVLLLTPFLKLFTLIFKTMSPPTDFISASVTCSELRL